MGTSPPRLPDQTAPTDAGPEPLAGPSRRRFLTRVAAGGAVLAAGSSLVPAGGLLPAALAQDAGGADEEDQDSELSPDEELVVHLTGLCLAAAKGYALAVDPETSPLAEPVAEVVRQLGANHTEQAAQLNELLPVAVENPNTTLEDELATSVAGASTDQDAMLGVLRELEESLAATEYVLLGAIDDQNDAKNVAAVLPVSGQEAVVLGALAGVPLAELVPDQQTGEGNLTVAAYPTDTDPGTSTDTESEGPVSNEGGTGSESGDTGGEEGTGQSGEGGESSGGGADADTEAGGGSATDG